MTSKTGSFEKHAAKALGGLKSALAEVFDSLPTRQQRASEVTSVLQIDKTLAWRISRIVSEPDLFAAAHHLPGPSAMASFLGALATAQLSPAIVQRVTDAARECEEMIGTHAGDRATFQIMLTPESAAESAVAHRKLAFRGNSFIWGRQAKTRLFTCIKQPSCDEPRKTDSVMVAGLFGLRRLRGEMPVTLHRMRYFETRDPVTPTTPGKGVPLDPTAAELALVPEFCTNPLPPIQVAVDSTGTTVWDLLPAGVGNTSAVTFVTAQVFRQMGNRYRSGDNTQSMISYLVGLPCESIVMDLIVREDLFGPLNPEVALYSELGAGQRYPGPDRERDRLPIAERVVCLGKGTSVVRTTDVPNYPRLAQHVFERLGWDASRFDVYRIRIEYPVVPATVVMRVPLLDG